MSLMQHYDKVITRMQLDICRLIEEKAEIEACVEALIAIRDQAREVHATGSGTYNDKPRRANQCLRKRQQHQRLR